MRTRRTARRLYPVGGAAITKCIYIFMVILQYQNRGHVLTLESGPISFSSIIWYAECLDNNYVYYLGANANPFFPTAECAVPA